MSIKETDIIIMRKIIIVLITVCVSSIFAFADSATTDKREDWKKELQEFKYQYLAQEVELTDEQQKTFFEMYSLMEAEKAKVGQECRRLRKKAKAENATDADYDAAVNAMIDIKLLEAQIEKRYYEKFKTILSSKQLYLLKRAEHKFMKKLMQMQKEDRKTKKKK